MDWSRKHGPRSSRGTAIPAESEGETSLTSRRTSRRQDISALREIDSYVGRSKWLRNPGTWISGVYGLVVLIVGVFTIGRGDGWGWAMAIMSLSFFSLFIWGLVWRWKSDMRRAYFRGRDHHFTALLRDIGDDARNS